ncbi:hypothetical protein [Paenibacillus humicola]|uniref:hypothetical protein n=1 Tax=Paenibacillus humicola TaxID=3110540 RepID=UPI00237BA86D|nr:hypothetical protein [Paenibacillus humicola]
MPPKDGVSRLHRIKGRKKNSPTGSTACLYAVAGDCVNPPGCGQQGPSDCLMQCTPRA